MTPGVGFVAFLVVTLAFLGGAVATGYAANRRVHIPLVICAILSLGVTIWFAEQLGTLYDLETAGRIYPIHLFLAKLTTVAYLLPVATGIATIRRPVTLRWHRRVAYLVLSLTILTAVTGTWMVLASERLSVVEG